MENKEQLKGNAPMPDNPKPTDELQLNIETVTPDTEKNVVPTDVADEQQMKEEEVESENGREQESSTTANEDKEKPETPDATEDSDEPSVDEREITTEETDKGDHPGDEIETVSP